MFSRYIYNNIHFIQNTTTTTTTTHGSISVEGRNKHNTQRTKNTTTGKEEGDGGRHPKKGGLPGSSFEYSTDGTKTPVVAGSNPKPIP